MIIENISRGTNLPKDFHENLVNEMGVNIRNFICSFLYNTIEYLPISHTIFSCLDFLDLSLPLPDIHEKI